ncbi:demethoxyubiquinone hydroxylase family protein [Bosea caraganae]|uniref:Demethoxyubiquinone hydroxylase family protein n=1 Tax=Bosea caraganae TaxID=2763117 RepID=A0A370L408_9HYPH|nr:demethoxyubiquinone hydroxylase family protein [Bosea caraganae]RDJ23608.1 demethoxyubiquinone hydroxylase family protein [Bosea caraganae]RDJ24424.1 demethoxyubiquinone hydroxylase family protein [Bosea caraganae]
MTISAASLARRDALTIKRIVRVNHAGEYGAIRIYSAQIAVARRLWPDMVPALRQMLADEIDHCTKFYAAMPERGSRPCRIMQLWSLGGSLLGLLTALMGRQAIWVCTAAVEKTVHRHLDEQLHFLQNRDAGLHAVINSIREEELAHLHHAEAQLGTEPRGSLQSAMQATIALVTEALIWLSTWGDSTRMTRALRQARL